jgi:hypothetical protein
VAYPGTGERAGSIHVAASLRSVTDPQRPEARCGGDRVGARRRHQRRLPAEDPTSGSGRPGGIADEGNTALAKAITEQGLSLDEYSSILVVAQNDPVVREKILQRIKPPAK